MASFNPWREAPPRATTRRSSASDRARSFNPWREAPPRATPNPISTGFLAFDVSIPGGKPLHEPPTQACVCAGICWSFNPWREAPPRATESTERRWHQHCQRFNPWREAPPRATLCQLITKRFNRRFQSLAGSPSTSHVALAQFEHEFKLVSIPGGKPLHEPLAHDRGIDYAMCEFQSLAGSPSTSHTIVSDQLTFSLLCFNPWREAPPRATVISLPLGKGL